MHFFLSFIRCCSGFFQLSSTCFCMPYRWVLFILSRYSQFSFLLLLILFEMSTATSLHSAHTATLNAFMFLFIFFSSFHTFLMCLSSHRVYKIGIFYLYPNTHINLSRPNSNQCVCVRYVCVQNDETYHLDENFSRTEFVTKIYWRWRAYTWPKQCSNVTPESHPICIFHSM